MANGGVIVTIGLVIGTEGGLALRSSMSICDQRGFQERCDQDFMCSNPDVALVIFCVHEALTDGALSEPPAVTS